MASTNSDNMAPACCEVGADQGRGTLATTPTAAADHRRRRPVLREMAPMTAPYAAEVDLETLTDDLVLVLEEAMQPAHVSL